MSPEYAMQGLFSEKSDVFSFGVLLLEIVIGRRNSTFYDDEHNLSLLGFVSLNKPFLAQLLTVFLLLLHTIQMSDYFFAFSFISFRYGYNGGKTIFHL